MKKLLFILIPFFIFLELSAQDSAVITPSKNDSVPAKNYTSVKKQTIPANSIIDSSSQKIQPFYYDSIFSAKNEFYESDIYEKRSDDNRDDFRFAIILFLMLVCVTWITFTYRKEFRENTTVLVNNGLGQQIYRDREFSASIFRILTFTNFAIITGVGIYLVAIKYDVPLLFNSMLFNIAAAVGFVLGAYLLKGIVYRSIGAIYQINPFISFFRFNSLVIYQMLGIALFPLIIFAVFAPEPVNIWSLYAAMAVFALALILRMVKGISLIGMLKEFHILYFLLYICALEIAPVLILVRLFSMWS